MSVMSLISPDKRSLVKRLIKKSVTHVAFNSKFISLKYDEHRIKNKVIVKKHDPWVGHWSKGINHIFMDDDITDLKEVISLLVHESIEKYVCEKYGLDDAKEGHFVAQNVEEKFAKKFLKLDWKEYSWHVEFVSRKEDKFLGGS